MGVGAGVVLKSPKGAVFENCLRLNFLATNEEAEYEAFIALRFPSSIFSDFKLVVTQVTGNFEVRGLRWLSIWRWQRISLPNSK